MNTRLCTTGNYNNASFGTGHPHCWNEIELVAFLTLGLDAITSAMPFEETCPAAIGSVYDSGCCDSPSVCEECLADAADRIESSESFQPKGSSAEQSRKSGKKWSAASNEAHTGALLAYPGLSIHHLTSFLSNNILPTYSAPTNTCAPWTRRMVMIMSHTHLNYKSRTAVCTLARRSTFQVLTHTTQQHALCDRESCYARLADYDGSSHCGGCGGLSSCEQKQIRSHIRCSRGEIDFALHSLLHIPSVL